MKRRRSSYSDRQRQTSTRFSQIITDLPRTTPRFWKASPKRQRITKTSYSISTMAVRCILRQQILAGASAAQNGPTLSSHALLLTTQWKAKRETQLHQTARATATQLNFLHGSSDRKSVV